MDTIWEYNRGNWTAIPDPLAPLDDDVDAALKKAGYTKDGTYGSKERV